MFELDTTNEYFLHLLHAGLTGAAPQKKPDDASFPEIYRLAKLHKVDDIVFAAISRLDAKPEFYEKWYKRHCMAVARHATQLYENVQICEALTAAGVQVLPYKGIVIKAYYPEASMRYMTDIDMMYLVPDDDHERVKNTMEALGYTTEKFGSGVHDIYHKPPLMCVELHRVIVLPDSDGYLSNADYIAAAKQDTQGRLSLPLPYLYFASLSHLVKHLRTDCTDLRSVADLYLLNRAMTDTEREQADALIQYASLTKTDHVIQAVAQCIFEGQMPDEHTQSCLAYLLRSPTDRQSADAKYLNTYKKGGSMGKAKLRYFLHLVFPNYAYMKTHYPILAKAPILLPLWWMVRWVDVLLHQRKRAKTALHRFDGMTEQDTGKARDELEMFGLK